MSWNAFINKGGFSRQRRKNRTRGCAVWLRACVYFTIISYLQAIVSSNAQAAQAGAAASAAGTLAQGMMQSLIPSLASMASGATAFGESSAEQSCCATGCFTGAGNNAAARGAGINAGAAAGAAGIAPPAFRYLPLPEEKLNILKLDRCEKHPEEKGCGKPETPLRANPSFWQQCKAGDVFKHSNLYKFLLPKTAEANGCADAAMGMAQGAMQMLAGILGMLAAMAAQKKQDQAQGTANNLSSVSNAASPAGTKLSEHSSAESIKVAASLLSKGKAGDIMDKFERRFGIPREKFAEAMLQGVDLRDLLASAPKNPIAKADSAAALDKASGSTAEQLAAATSKGDLGELQKELGTTGTELELGGSAIKKKLSKASAFIPFQYDSEKVPELAPVEDKSALLANLSPEVRAALEQEQMQRQRNGETESSIFQVVHEKYQQQFKMLYGVGIGSGGIANANGQ